MDMMHIPKEKFAFCQSDAHLHDKKLETKPVGFFRDVFRRFCKNKGSVVAAYIILALVLFAIVVPIVASNPYSEALTDTTYLKYKNLLPKSTLFSWAGWDGGKDETINNGRYSMYMAYYEETGMNAIMEEYKSNYVDLSAGPAGKTTYYDVRIDSYLANGMYYLTISKAEYENIMKWQDENNIQVLYPAVDVTGFTLASQKFDANLWYECNEKSVPKLDDDGNFISKYIIQPGNDYNSLRIAGDDGSYIYRTIGGTGSDYNVRVNSYTYFQYRYGFEPSFLLGTNSHGQDILTRLASGARFSLMLSITVASVNLIIGAIIGAIMGYYGGTIDLIMDRVLDILGGIPFMVVTALFQLHFMNKVGPVVSLLFAFFLTGWIGMASRVRMQFYRFKHQEYILAARTLGARDTRLMFRHIFPNAIGTIITGSVLSIPGVIFSESSLTYLGIVNLESSTMTSVGTMLANGRANYTAFPHIVIFPAVFIALLEISFNLFGNGLRDAFNPSLRGSED